jgi:hydrogenase maturation protease
MIAIIGCGNLNRSDDGAGPEVLRLLKSSYRDYEPEALRLLDAGTDGIAVMFAARGCKTLIVVDACRTGAAPGSVFEVPGSEVGSRHLASLTLHDFRWDHALFAGRQIFRDDFPSDVTAFLIEAESIELGLGLSKPVAAAVYTVASRISAIASSSERRAS